jgi:hypothetical protein
MNRFSQYSTLRSPSLSIPARGNFESRQGSRVWVKEDSEKAQFILSVVGLYLRCMIVAEAVLSASPGGCRPRFRTSCEEVRMFWSHIRGEERSGSGHIIEVPYRGKPQLEADPWEQKSAPFPCGFKETGITNINRRVLRVKTKATG